MKERVTFVSGFRLMLAFHPFRVKGRSLNFQ